MDSEKIIRFEALKRAFSFQRPPARRPALATGCNWLDPVTGGLSRDGLNELCGSSGSGPLFLEQLLCESERCGSYLALVDGSDSFDPTQYRAPLLRRLLWVRCKEVPDAIRATDLLIRDGNLPLIVLDLQAAPALDLRRIPASTWHRYTRLLESHGPALLVLSRAPMVEGARLRLHCRMEWSLESMELPRREIAFRPEIQERGRQWHETKEEADVQRHSG